MRQSHRVAVNMGILYARMAVTVFVSLYATRVTLAALGVADFGIFNIVAGTIAMLTFLNASMAAATQRFLSHAQGSGDLPLQRRIFNASLLLHAGVALAVLFLLEAAGWILFNGVLNIAPDRMQTAWMVYRIAAVQTVATIATVPYDAALNARENMLVFAILGVLEAVLRLGVALAVVEYAGDRLLLFAVLTAASTFAVVGIRSVYCHARYAECALLAPKALSRADFSGLANFAGWSFLGSSASMLANYGQGIVLNTHFGTTVNAAQGIANQVSGQLGAFASTMLRALNPVIAKSEGAGDRALMLRATATGSKAGFVLLMVFYVPVLVETPYILELWLGNPPAWAVEFCRLLLLRNLVEQLFVTLAASIAAVGRIREYQIVSSILSLLPLGAAAILFSLGAGPETMYLAFLGYSVVASWVILHYASTLCGLDVRGFLGGVVARCTAAFGVSGLAAAAAWILVPQGPARLVAVASASAISYFPSIWWIALSPHEREFGRRTFGELAARIRKGASNPTRNVPE